MILISSKDDSKWGNVYMDFKASSQGNAQAIKIHVRG